MSHETSTATTALRQLLDERLRAHTGMGLDEYVAVRRNRPKPMGWDKIAASLQPYGSITGVTLRSWYAQAA